MTQVRFLIKDGTNLPERCHFYLVDSATEVLNLPAMSSSVERIQRKPPYNGISPRQIRPKRSSSIWRDRPVLREFFAASAKSHPAMLRPVFYTIGHDYEASRRLLHDHRGTPFEVCV